MIMKYGQFSLFWKSIIINIIIILMKNFWALAIFSTLSSSIIGSIAQSAGTGCCTQFKICGQTFAYCATGCQIQCTSAGEPPQSSSEGDMNITTLISRNLFDQMLKHRNDDNCPGKGFYTYDSFIAAVKSFNDFASTGDINTRKREIAAFLAQTSHETTGGWISAPDGPYAWGYCYIQEQSETLAYCDESASKWPWAPGKKYFGRGPIQITYNFNYGLAGQAIGIDLLKNPDLVATDAIVSFKTALWFWMTPVSSNRSCHDVMTAANTADGMVAGYGGTTKIINGGTECGKGGAAAAQESRIGFYKRYCDLLKVGYGNNLEC
ncbi:basic endochitinase-like [Impatiens glandulifera]|uniref:basic endochitinase-like n=1 Tax=Impatiens glandulifera TaxID=253017 RepID=UPI001FB0FA36|nr:basic endochitinase-like [Impatiens glandulifera]